MNLKFATIILFLLTLGPCNLCKSDPIVSHDENSDHGVVQVTALSNDRPQLKTILQPQSEIWKWMVDAFNYSDGGAKIFWDPGLTSKANNYSVAESETYRDTSICFIRADKTYKYGPFIGVNVPTEELLEAIVMELNNVRQHSEFSKINQMAIDSKISREDYILGCANIEFKSQAGVRAFFENVWMPYCAKYHIHTDQQIWANCKAEKFEYFMQRFPKDSPYPWKFYGDQYDSMTNSNSAKSHSN